MVRSDGSTRASMHTLRSNGAFIKYHTHQGFSDTSTWGRAQGWGMLFATQSYLADPSHADWLAAAGWTESALE